MKIYIDKPFLGGLVKIFVLEEKGRERYAITLDRTTKLLTQKKIEDGSAEEAETFIELPVGFFNDFVKAITDYASNNNIKTESETLLQGKLGATERHLEDMRKIVFKDYDKPNA
jgi:hypothetical protein